MPIDLTPLSVRELDALIRDARARHTTLTERPPAARVRRLLAAQARTAGYTIEEIFGIDAATAPPEPKARARRKRGKDDDAT